MLMDNMFLFVAVNQIREINEIFKKFHISIKIPSKSEQKGVILSGKQ